MKNDILSKLTVVILTYKTDKKILIDCINSIDKSVKVLIVENSKCFEYRNEFLERFSNLSIICSGSNLGFGAGYNYGFENIKSDYALVLAPDTICNKNFFEKIKFYLSEDIDFSIIGVKFNSDNVYPSYGFFNKTDSFEYNDFFLKEVDWVVGCAMLINLNKYDKKKIFDENIFIYFEEFDLCKNTIKNGGKVFTSSILIVKHLGNMGSIASNQDFKETSNNFRDWHWMWSQFYFYKKNYGFPYALLKFSSKFFKGLFKIFIFKLLNDQRKFNNAKFRFLGLYHSIIGNKSFYRIED